MLVLSSLVLGFAMLDAFSGFVVVWLHPMPMRPCLDVTIWDALPWCQLLHAYLSLFPFHAMICLPCLFAPPIGFLCFFTCLLVCHPCFNTMKLWTSDPNLRLSRAPPFVCFLVWLFAFLLVCLLSYFFACHVYRAYLLCASFICILHLFLPLPVCWFLVFAFVCTHMDRGHMELGHNLTDVGKKGMDASM